MFRILALPLAGYVLFAVVQGKVVVKQGLGAETVSRCEQPVYFWVCCGIYAVLAIAMATIF